MVQKAFLSKKIVSSDGPKQEEMDHEPTLLFWCATRIEPQEESNRRRAVLQRLYYLVKQWIRHTMITQFHMPQSAAAQVEGRIFATGSYRYNVHTSGSDIDMVLIAPNRITREHFFDTLAPRLKNELWVGELHCIRESRVPIIAMVCDGIDIDLSFGAIRHDRVPQVITDDLLQGLDEQSVLSCNAVRVAHNVMDLVPNKATFRQTLRFIKAWGKVRNIYSNTFGFPSGIGWAILVAFVCQCYPRQNVAGTVGRFFRTYHVWFRPNPHESGMDNRAIYLTESMRARTNLGRCWDPRQSRSDAMALFPVLTPALPYGNACYNVTLTNLRQLCDQFARGHAIVSTSLHLSPQSARQQLGQYGIWSKLLQPIPFFNLYKHYMHIRIACSDPELYQAYVDGVESRIRILWAGNASSRGHTLQDIKQLRLHLNPRRFEDPVEVERRAKLLKKKNETNKANERMSAGSSSMHSNPASTRTSLQLGGNASKRADSINNQHADSNNTSNSLSLFTAHYFIGMTVDTTISKSQIDLAPAIRTFRVVVRQLRQYKEGVTKIPQIGVCTVDKIPDFVKVAAGYTDNKTDEHQDKNSGSTIQDENEHKQQNSTSSKDADDKKDGNWSEQKASNKTAAPEGENGRVDGNVNKEVNNVCAVNDDNNFNNNNMSNVDKQINTMAETSNINNEDSNALHSWKRPRQQEANVNDDTTRPSSSAAVLLNSKKQKSASAQVEENTLQQLCNESNNNSNNDRNISTANDDDYYKEEDDDDNLELEQALGLNF